MNLFGKQKRDERIVKINRKKKPQIDDDVNSLFLFSSYRRLLAATSHRVRRRCFLASSSIH